MIEKMEFTTHNDGTPETGGTSLMGYIEVDYKLLVEKFEQPNNWDTYKSDAEWDIEFTDGTVATIYNYKTGRNYLREDGLNVEDITTWHIGGKSDRALKLVKLIIESKE